jgi:hypothetical protein
MVQRDGGREMPIGYEILELVEPEQAGDRARSQGRSRAVIRM